MSLRSSRRKVRVETLFLFPFDDDNHKRLSFSQIGVQIVYKRMINRHKIQCGKIIGMMKR